MPEAKIQFYYDKSSEINKIYNSEPLHIKRHSDTGSLYLQIIWPISEDLSNNHVYVSYDNCQTWNLQAISRTVYQPTGITVWETGMGLQGNDVWIKADFGTSTKNATIVFQSESDVAWSIQGNPLSLLVGDNDDYNSIHSIANIQSGAFYGLFADNTNIIDASRMALTLDPVPNAAYRYMFAGCTNLIKAPKLPATTLSQRCYESMFNQCSSLSTAPVLPATTLASLCYYEMFKDCTSLVTAPALPATTLANSCYAYMFNGCTALVNTPELPATTLTQRCYYNMFNGCTSLIATTQLPATTAVDSCYYDMFKGCTSLVNVPDLPATTLAPNCYREMFYGCTSLVNAPVLPATILTTNCYREMFYGCSSLNYIKALFIASPLVNGSYTYTNLWVANVAAYGTFVQHQDAEWELYNDNAIPTTWRLQKDIPVDKKKYKVYIEHGGFGSGTASVEYDAYAAGDIVRVTATPDQWSYFKCWYEFEYGTTGISPNFNNIISTDAVYSFTMPARDVYLYAYFTNQDPQPYTSQFVSLTALEDNTDFYFYAMETTDSEGEPIGPPSSTSFILNYWKSGSDWQSVTGNRNNDVTQWDDTTKRLAKIITLNANETVYLKCDLTDYEDPVYGLSIYSNKNYTIKGNLWSLVTGEDLDPSLTDYQQFTYFPWTFYHALDAAEQYSGLITDASGLKFSNVFFKYTIPVDLVPPTGQETPENTGHPGFFMNQTALEKAPEKLSVSVSSYGYEHMFDGCISLTVAPYLPSSWLNEGCYKHMFANCTSLVNAPALNATSLAQYCYYGMFFGCTALETGPALPATTVPAYAYARMFMSCTSLVNAPRIPATTLNEYSCSYMFAWCTSLNNPPELKTTTVYDHCYEYMFSECWNLANAPKLPATLATKYPDDILHRGYHYEGMFFRCVSLTMPPDLPSTVLFDGCYSKMFQECTSMIMTPELNVTTLADGCYSYMFKDCTSVRITPKLNATTLAESCYSHMFDGCTVLEIAPRLPATNLAVSCYNSMFSGCTLLSDLPALPATTLAQWCYNSMFMYCTTITKAPDLPATNLVPYCYDTMFYGCENLNSIRILAETHDETILSITDGMLENIATSGNFYCKEAYGWTTGYDGVPAGWTIHYI